MIFLQSIVKISFFDCKNIKIPGRASPQKARAGFAPRSTDGLRPKRPGQALFQEARVGFAPKGPGGLRPQYPKIGILMLLPIGCR